MTAASTLHMLDQIASSTATIPVVRRPASTAVVVVDDVAEDRASRYHRSTAVGR